MNSSAWHEKAVLGSMYSSISSNLSVFEDSVLDEVDNSNKVLDIFYSFAIKVRVERNVKTFNHN